MKNTTAQVWMTEQAYWSARMADEKFTEPTADIPTAAARLIMFANWRRDEELICRAVAEWAFQNASELAATGQARRMDAITAGRAAMLEGAKRREGERRRELAAICGTVHATAMTMPRLPSGLPWELNLWGGVHETSDAERARWEAYGDDLEAEVMPTPQLEGDTWTDETDGDNAD